MRSTNRKRSLLVSGAVILLAMTVIVGMTWALFTDTLTVTNHLEAGDLTIELSRVELTKTTLNEKGYLETETVQTTDDDPVVFSNRNTNNENVFGIVTDQTTGEVEKVVPGSEFVATMKIENKSDVAFGYWFKIVCDDTTNAQELAEQLIITVYRDLNGDGVIDKNTESVSTTTHTVATGIEVGDEDDYVGVLELGRSENFIISVEFDDMSYTYVDGVLESDNDSAKSQTVDFDLVVYAVQVTEE